MLTIPAVITIVFLAMVVVTGWWPVIVTPPIYWYKHQCQALSEPYNLASFPNAPTK